MFTFIVYNLQIDKQSKRINQIIKIILRFHVTAFLNEN